MRPSMKGFQLIFMTHFFKLLYKISTIARLEATSKISQSGSLAESFAFLHLLTTSILLIFVQKFGEMCHKNQQYMHGSREILKNQGKLRVVYPGNVTSRVGKYESAGNEILEL